jgi:hypothetical protein
MFTLRRYAFYTTLAITGIGVGLLKLGYDYTNTINQSQAAFEAMGLGSRKAKRYVDDLFTVAAATPLTFEQVTDAARKFMALGGLGTGSSIKAIKALGDNLSAMGKFGTANITRATIALSHMLGMGRLTQQVLTQLQRDNVNMTQALEQYYHTNQAGIREMTRRGLIDSVKALQIWEDYVHHKFPKAAEKLLKSSLPLLMTSVRDYLGKFMSALERPLLFRTLKLMSRINDGLKVASKASEKHGFTAGLVAFDKNLHAWGAIAGTVGFIINMFKLFGTILTRVLIPALGVLLAVSRPIMFIFGGIADNVTVLINKFGPFRYLVIGIATAYMALYGAMLLWEITTKTGAGLLRILTLAKLQDTLVTWANTRAVLTLGGAQAASLGTLGRLKWAFRDLTYMILMQTAALLADPLFWIGFGIVALATMTVLYYKWRKFHDLVNETFDWIRKNQWWVWWIPGVQMLLTLYYLFRGIKNLIVEIRNLVQKPLDWHTWDNFLGMPGMPKMPGEKGGGGGGFWHGVKTFLIGGAATGGTIPYNYNQPFMVGERGPELAMQTSTGTRIVPLQFNPTPVGRATVAGGMGQAQPIVVQVQLQLDRRVLAEAVAHARADAQARA